jgi:hypothetical protein
MFGGRRRFEGGVKHHLGVRKAKVVVQTLLDGQLRARLWVSGEEQVRVVVWERGRGASAHVKRGWQRVEVDPAQQRHILLGATERLAVVDAAGRPYGVAAAAAAEGMVADEDPVAHRGRREAH